MLKKLVLAIAAIVATMGIAFAQVDVNKADQAALDTVKGIGPAKSKAILDERAKGEFKDWADFEKRVKGVGDKNAVRLSEAGLQVNGKSRDGAAAKPAKPADKADKADKAAAAKPVDKTAAAEKPKMADEKKDMAKK
jgi:competence protein ComEA